MILVQSGDQARQFDASFVAGRAGRGAELEIDDEYVSPRHALFRFDGTDWTVEDLGSTNGTWLGAGYRSRIYGPHRLAKGDKLRIGHTVLTVVPAG